MMEREEELTFITRVQWLSLRGLNNQYAKLSGCALTPTTCFTNSWVLFNQAKTLRGSWECQKPELRDGL